MKRIFLFSAVVLLLNAGLFAQKNTRNSFELAAGIQSYYAPLKHFTIRQPQPVVIAGYNHHLNRKQSIELGIRIGYNRNKFQGDAMYVEALFRYTPVIAKHIQPIIGTGAGYQLSFYPSSSLKWDNTDWVKGRSYKAVVQVPLHLGLGYRSIKSKKAIITPYVLYQANALFRYSPDLTPMPSSNFLFGIKYSPTK
ncbi:MAG: hypothetical protein QM725_00260 [Lacibacter sp.]